jgi:hypothetical protein
MGVTRQDISDRGGASRSSIRTLAGNLALAAVSLTVFFGALETGVRLFWSQEGHAPHSGLVLQGVSRRVIHEGVEYRTNGHGIREPELPPKAAGEHRILLLGDSFVWGDGLREEDTVARQLQRRLDPRGKRYRVINAGISGFDTRDELEQLRRLAPVYQPDTVVLFFFTNDVLARQDRALEGRGAASSWRQNLKESLRENSKLFAFLYYLYKDVASAYIGVPRALLAPDYFDLDERKPGWTAFLESFAGIRDYCAARGIGFAFVIIPTLTNLNDKYPFAELRQKVSGTARAAAVPHVDLFDLYAGFRPMQLWVNPENSHWNGRATAIAADALLRLLQSSGLAGKAQS